MINKLIILTI